MLGSRNDLSVSFDRDWTVAEAEMLDQGSHREPVGDLKRLAVYRDVHAGKRRPSAPSCLGVNGVAGDPKLR